MVQLNLSNHTLIIYICLLLVDLCLLYVHVHARPPQNPVQCNMTLCTVYNTYAHWGDRTDCTSPNIAYPTTEEQLRLAVANANRNNLKVKVVTKFSHSIPKLACPSSQTNKTMLISTKLYDSGIEIDVINKVVTADAGVGLRDLINKVEANGLSLLVSPYWDGVTVGGIISTGAHGSSWWGRGGSVHNHVVGMRVVVPGSETEGYAKVLNLEGDDPLLKAAKVSLGVLGVISKVKFSVEEVFKRSITLKFRRDENIEDEYIKHAKENEFGDIVWYPSMFEAVYRLDNRVPFNTSGDGIYDFIGFHSFPILVSSSTRTSEKIYESTRDVNSKCIMASSLLATKKLVANGLKNNDLIFTGYPVIGTQAKMQASGACLYSSPSRIDLTCAWDPLVKGLSFFETTAIFPSSKLGDFIRDVKKLREMTNSQYFCGIDVYYGFLMRFIKASDAYLGHSEESVAVDINYYRADDAKTPRLNQDIYEEIEQMAFFKYKAKPHWGKNRNLAFIGVTNKYPNWGKFIQVKKQLDPKEMFSSEWSNEILYGEERKKKDGCALEGLCICSQDTHCSPSKGYLCKQGLVYQEARVCRFSPLGI